MKREGLVSKEAGPFSLHQYPNHQMTSQKEREYQRKWRLENAEYRREYQKQWRENNKGKQSKYYKTWKLKNPWKAGARYRKHKLSEAQFKELKESQKGLCAICQKPQVNRKGRSRELAIDHDHQTGRVRGLLCDPCNLLLGYVENHLERFQRLVMGFEKYLNNSKLGT